MEQEVIMHYKKRVCEREKNVQINATPAAMDGRARR